MRRVRIQFDAVGIVHAADISGKFDNRYLHAQAEAKIGNTVCSCIVCRSDHTFYAAVSKAAGNNDSLCVS